MKVWGEEKKNLMKILPKFHKISFNMLKVLTFYIFLTGFFGQINEKH